jgi:hypothetical protein
MDTKSAQIIADAIILHAEAIKGLSKILDKATGATRDMPYLEGLGIAIGGDYLKHAVGEQLGRLAEAIDAAKDR